MCTLLSVAPSVFHCVSTCTDSSSAEAAFPAVALPGGVTLATSTSRSLYSASLHTVPSPGGSGAVAPSRGARGRAPGPPTYRTPPLPTRRSTSTRTPRPAAAAATAAALKRSAAYCNVAGRVRGGWGLRRRKLGEARGCAHLESGRFRGAARRPRAACTQHVHGAQYADLREVGKRGCCRARSRQAPPVPSNSCREGAEQRDQRPRQGPHGPPLPGYTPRLQLVAHWERTAAVASVLGPYILDFCIGLPLSGKSQRRQRWTCRLLCKAAGLQGV